jgi:hypothetical protein
MSKKILESYTGNAFLNNAIQTIEVLAGLEEVSQITTDTLHQLYEKYKPWDLYKRMKSYTMLFSRNGPLLNNEEFGSFIYKSLIENIINEYECDGPFTCEISGLKFEKTFSEHYRIIRESVADKIKDTRTEPKKLKKDLRNLYKTDISISRCWFPLVGSLGSDAQALPQAVNEIQIHPICLVVIQFLPFSAVLYKGGVLLIDSLNFDFAKSFIKKHVNTILETEELKSQNSKVENVRFSKGEYITHAIDIYSKKVGFYYDDDYTDLNLWSFSNSGTGASCEIDRIPNQVFKKLYLLGTNPQTSNDFKRLISIPESFKYPSLIDCLNEKKDFWALYPRVRKKEEIKGVSVEFYDAFNKLIQRDRLIPYAKYIAYLFSEDKKLNDKEKKLLENKEATFNDDYNTLFYKMLVEATINGKWSLKHHIEILDPSESKLIIAWTYRIHKMVHFYYNQRAFVKELPNLFSSNDDLYNTLAELIYLIKTDEKSEKSIGRLLSAQEYEGFSINPTLVRKSENIDLETIIELTYKDYKPRRKDLNKLLRIYFSQSDSSVNPERKSLNKPDAEKESNEFKIYQEFVEDFNKYCVQKRELIDSEKSSKEYFGRAIKRFPKKPNDFKFWMLDYLKNMKDFYNKQAKIGVDSGSVLARIDNYKANILYDPLGEMNLSFSRFTIQFILNKELTKLFTKQKSQDNE